MPLMQGTTQAPALSSYQDGATPAVLSGRQGDMIVSELHGKYYTQTQRGNCYYASTAAAGLAFSIFSATTFLGLMLLNPMGSGKNLSLIRSMVGLNAASATAASAFGYAWATNVNTPLSTAYTAFGALTTTRGSCLLGPVGQGNSVVLTATTATIAAASVFTWGRSANFSTSTGAVGTVLGSTMFEDFDGQMIVPPGTLFTLTSSILGGGTNPATLIWEELPI